MSVCRRNLKENYLTSLPSACFGGKYCHMRIKRASESLLISTFLNTQSPPEEFGVTQEMIHSYPSEFQWLVSYPKLYGEFPTSDALLYKFPDFPFTTDAKDMAFAADEVLNAYSRRSLIQAIQTAGEHIEEGDIEDAIMSITSFMPPVRSKPISNDLDDFSLLDSYEDFEDTVKTPWSVLQEVTGGIREGDFWIVAARLSQGKSFVLARIATEALMEGRNVRFYSLEMSKKQVLTRMHVLLGAALGMDVDHVAMRDKVFDPIAYRKIVQTISKEVPGELSVMDSSDGKVSPTTLVQDKGWADLTIVDYIGLMSTPAGSRAVDDWRGMASISNSIKEIAVSHSMRIIAASQINREGDTGLKPSPPKVKNLSQADSLGQDADVVLTHKQLCKTAMIYSIEKNRHGSSGEKFYSDFMPNIGSFGDLTKRDAMERREEEMED